MVSICPRESPYVLRTISQEFLQCWNNNNKGTFIPHVTSKCIRGNFSWWRSMHTHKRTLYSTKQSNNNNKNCFFNSRNTPQRMWKKSLWFIIKFWDQWISNWKIKVYALTEACWEDTVALRSPASTFDPAQTPDLPPSPAIPACTAGTPASWCQAPTSFCKVQSIQFKTLLSIQYYRQRMRLTSR